MEAKLRLVDFVVDADVLRQLEEAGADPLLLNWLGNYSIELQPLMAECLSLLQEKRSSRVIEVCTEILRRSPRLVHSYMIRGSAYRSQSKLQDAETDFRSALNYYPNSSRVRILLAETLISHGDTEEAIQYLNWVLQHSSAAGVQDWPTAHRLLAQAYIKTREYRLASSHLHTVLWQLPYPNPESVALLPDLEDHMSVLAQLLALCPDPEVSSPLDAIEIAQLMKLLASNDSQQQIALLRIAEGQAADGQFDAAIATQGAAEILSSGPATESIRERLNVYRKQQVPTLPASDSPSRTSTSSADSRGAADMFLQQMILIPAVSETNDADKKPSPAYYIGKHEVSRDEWADIMDTVPIAPHDLPMDQISWDDCQTFLTRLNEKSGPKGLHFRLPSLAEWKQAAQGKNKTRFYFGDDPAELLKHGWFADQSHESLQRVGTLQPNPSGLCDVYGNVAEWCQDEEKLGKADSKSKVSVRFRVFVGGSYLNKTDELRSDLTGFARQNEARRGLGFRLAADIPQEEDSSSGPSVTNETKPVAKSHRAGISLAIESVRTTLETDALQRGWLQERLFTLLYLQACVRSNLKDIDTARSNLRALIREMPDDNSPLMQLARCHLAWIQATQSNATPEQIAEAKKIVENSLTRAEFKLWVGYLTQSTVLMIEGDQDAAIRRATQAADLAPIRFKEICSAQLKALQDKKSVVSREFPVPPSFPPAIVVGQ